MGYDEETKKKLKASVEAYIKKNDPRRDRRRNSSPEKDFVKKLIAHLKLKGFFVSVVEAKATYSEKSKRYMSSQVGSSGFCDIVGNAPDGRAVFIEVKAEGKLATIRENQYHFLMEKINSNCFAVCIDSIKRVDMLYDGFINLPTTKERQEFLRHYRPKFKPKKLNPNHEFNIDEI